MNLKIAVIQLRLLWPTVPAWLLAENKAYHCSTATISCWGNCSRCPNREKPISTELYWLIPSNGVPSRLSTSLSVHQGEQLRRILQLQVLHAVPCVFAALLPLHYGDRSEVLHQVLDGTSSLPTLGTRCATLSIFSLTLKLHFKIVWHLIFFFLPGWR